VSEVEARLQGLEALLARPDAPAPAQP
jgi:hypothetical protein